MGNSDPKPCLVVGLGNPLMRDEGVGIQVVTRLERSYASACRVDFLDAGTGGVALVHAMADRQKVVFIDCARMGQSPGIICRFEADDVSSTKDMPEMSLHEADLMEIIRLADQLGQCPDEVVIFGIEPKSVQPGHELTSELEGKVSGYVRKVAREFRDFT